MSQMPPDGPIDFQRNVQVVDSVCYEVCSMLTSWKRLTLFNSQQAKCCCGIPTGTRLRRGKIGIKLGINHRLFDVAACLSHEKRKTKTRKVGDKKKERE